MTTVGMKRPCLGCGVAVDPLVIDTVGQNVLVRCPECGHENEAKVIYVAGYRRGEKALSVLPTPDSNQERRSDS